MPSTTPLTDSINALTTYANTVTGGSDTDLSSAVATLAAGYGGGGGYSVEDIATRNISGALTISTATTVANGAFQNTGVASVTSKSATFQANAFYGCASLTTVDYVPEKNFCDGQRVFENCTSLNVIILRSTVRKSLLYSNSLNNTPFASGKAGGTVYIPESLYNHIGDNTSDDYKKASGWSTIDGYGTITWAKIEGSYYETHYADGTLIPT